MMPRTVSGTRRYRPPPSPTTKMPVRSNRRTEVCRVRFDVAEISLVPAPFDRDRHLSLLLEADDAEEHMSGYLDRGELLEIHGADGVIGVVVLVREADEVEIWNIALVEDYRGRGLGRVAIGAIADRCTRAGASHLTVGTSDCSLGTIAFYRKAGFRFAGVRQGYFDTNPMAVVENGIRARDMVMFRMALPPDSTRT